MARYKFRYIDLFSGIGGFRVALDSLGGRSVGFSEIDKFAIETYKSNFNDPEDHDLGDVTQIEDIPEADLIVGGVPCQSWSVAGKMKGFDDPRGKLWFDSIEIVRKTKPRVFMFENVKGLADPRNAAALNLIIESFEKNGYLVKYKVLDAYDFGCPQNRSRIFIVGFRNEFKKEFEKFEFPTAKKHDLALADFLQGVQKQFLQKKKFSAEELFEGKVPMSRNNFQKDDELNDFFVMCDTRNGHTSIHSWDIRETTESQKSICMTIMKNRRKKKYGLYDGNPLSFEDIKELYSKATKKDVDELVKKKILRYTDDGKIDLVHSKNSAGIDNIYRVYLPNSAIFSTLTATGTKDYISEVYIEANSVEEYRAKFIDEVLKKRKIRPVTPREASNIQGFPKDFVLHKQEKHANKQIGNSVAPPVVAAVGEQILRTGVFSK
ncbi:MAG: DNA (cytosine-5-)-methyltransferase [Candidatus Pacebacteria bacterium]|nr:DNA (cytosine-5-)-methyltransferase [Candidatus Paceibacterota bacterium]